MEDNKLEFLIKKILYQSYIKNPYSRGFKEFSDNLDKEFSFLGRDSEKLKKDVFVSKNVSSISPLSQNIKKHRGRPKGCVNKKDKK